jgi:hypothetical protein
MITGDEPTFPYTERFQEGLTIKLQLAAMNMAASRAYAGPEGYSSDYLAEVAFRDAQALIDEYNKTQL